MAAFCAASAPEMSSVGSASAYPSRVAVASAVAKSSPCSSIRSSTKLVVPFTMPRMRRTWSPASPSRSGRMIGMAPATAAS